VLKTTVSIVRYKENLAAGAVLERFVEAFCWSVLLERFVSLRKQLNMMTDRSVYEPCQRLILVFGAPVVGISRRLWRAIS
jgi:hypothetical protein